MLLERNVLGSPAHRLDHRRDLFRPDDALTGGEINCCGNRIELWRAPAIFSWRALNHWLPGLEIARGDERHLANALRRQCASPDSSRNGVIRHTFEPSGLGHRVDVGPRDDVRDLDLF